MKTCTYLTILIASTVLIACNGNKSEEINPASVDSIISISHELLRAGKFDSAKTAFASAAALPGSKIDTASIFMEMEYLIDDGKTNELLMGMMEEDYKLLLGNKYQKDFFFLKDSVIEQEVWKKLFEKRLLRSAMLKDRDAVRKKVGLVVSKEKNETGSIQRSDFAEALQFSYYEKGLNVKVETNGRYHDEIRLEYSMINEVWAHHFKKGDLLPQMVQIGFKRIELSDGFDFSRSFRY